MKFPTNLEELGSLAALLNHYKETHFTYVLLLFSAAYLYKQTFAIPGSVFMVSASGENNLFVLTNFKIMVALPCLWENPIGIGSFIFLVI